MWKCQEKVKTKSSSGDMRITNKAELWPALSSPHCLTFGFQSLVAPLVPCSTTEVGCADLAPGATGAWHGSHINRAVRLGVLSVCKLSLLCHRTKMKVRQETGGTFTSVNTQTIISGFHRFRPARSGCCCPRP